MRLDWKSRRTPYVAVKTFAGKSAGAFHTEKRGILEILFNTLAL